MLATVLLWSLGGAVSLCTRRGSFSSRKRDCICLHGDLGCQWAFNEGRHIREDSIVMLSFTYGAAYASRVGARSFQFQIPFRVSSENQILETFEEALTKEREEHPRSITCLAVFDRIISMSIMILPIRELVKLCRSYVVLESSFIDGTQGVGNLEVSMDDIDADFYISNSEPLVAVPKAIKFEKGVFGSIEDCSTEENYWKIVAVEEMLAVLGHITANVCSHDHGRSAASIRR